MKLTFALLFSVLLFVSVDAACKSGDPFSPSDPSNLEDRLFSFIPSTAVDPAEYSVDQITVTTYNLQSGFSYACAKNAEAQVAHIVNCHYFAAQEVDINSTHCDCVQPQIAADATRKNVAYLRTIYFGTGGLYGHMSGSVYEILETKWILFNARSSESRGALAQRTQPPQLKGRDLWLVSTHLQFDSELIRDQQAVELVQFVKDIRANYSEAVYLIPGDWYVSNGEASYDTLAAYLNDSYVSFTGRFTGGSTYPSPNPNARYDYVWFLAPADFEVRVTNYQVINTQDSDHSPLRVNFGFPSLYASSGTALPAEAGVPYPVTTTTTSSASGVVIGLTSVLSAVLIALFI